MGREKRTVTGRARVAVERAEALPPRAKLLRPKGAGGVSLRESDGRYLARAPVTGETIAVCETREQAEGVLSVRYGASAVGMTADTRFEAWVGHVLAVRESLRYRNVEGERHIAHTHVEGDALGGMTLREIDASGTETLRAWLGRMLCKRAVTPAHIKTPRHKGLLSRRTVDNALSLVRVSLQYAVDAGLLERNVARDVRVPRPARATEREEFPGVLEPEEQRRLLVVTPRATVEGVMTRVGLGLGLRKNELLSLRVSDVHLRALAPCVVIRRGGKRGQGPTKGGKPRRLPLFGLALNALREWLDGQLWAEGQAPDRLVFQGPKGGRLDRVPYREFHEALKRACIDRGVHWHDLRHTCATSLLLGWWGRKWSVREVQQLLGHSSVRVTERYLHARNELIFQAASEMRSRDAIETLRDSPSERQMVHATGDEAGDGQGGGDDFLSVELRGIESASPKRRPRS